MVPPLSLLLEPDRKWKLDKVFDSGPLMTTLGLHELFVVYIIAIAHDVGHPGFTNVFMASTSALPCRSSSANSRSRKMQRHRCQ